MPTPSAEITLTTSCALGLVAIASGQEYQRAHRALKDAGFRRLSNGVFVSPLTDARSHAPGRLGAPLNVPIRIRLCPDTSASLPIPSTATSPKPTPGSPATWLTGSSPASSSSPFPVPRAATGSPIRTTTARAAPARPRKICAASATRCTPPPPSPARRARPNRA